MNRLYWTFLLILSIGLCLYACSDNESKEEKYKIMTLKVAAYRDNFVSPEHGITTDILGFVVTDENNRTYIIETIEGFEEKYQEGYEYVIKVKAIDKNQGEPIEDVFGYYYYLLEILKKEKVETKQMTPNYF